jgi:hypothetical protein
VFDQRNLFNLSNLLDNGLYKKRLNEVNWRKREDYRIVKEKIERENDMKMLKDFAYKFIKAILFD